jgi:hypothetical protein
LRDSRPTSGYRITTTDFRPGSSRRSRRQAGFCRYAPERRYRRRRANRARASVTLSEATAPVKLPTCHGPAEGLPQRREHAASDRVVFHWPLPRGWRPRLDGSHLCYTVWCSEQWQAAVKVHGVFLSCRGDSESSPRLQFRRAPGRDSAQVVTPFVQVGTYPTRNFATLGPL